jgi:hypothetical protein
MSGHLLQGSLGYILTRLQHRAHQPVKHKHRENEKMKVKGTVWPDWICMRVVPLESPLKGHQPLYILDFLISVLNI